MKCGVSTSAELGVGIQVWSKGVGTSVQWSVGISEEWSVGVPVWSGV